MLFLVVLQTIMDRSGVIEGAADAPDVWRAYESVWKAASVIGRKQSLLRSLARDNPAPYLAGSNRVR